MTAYGPTKKEKWEFVWNAIGISLGSASTALFWAESIVESYGFALFIVPSLFIVALSTILLFNGLEKLALRIRIEESQRTSELIDEIVTIYREEPR